MDSDSQTVPFPCSSYRLFPNYTIVIFIPAGFPWERSETGIPIPNADVQLLCDIWSKCGGVYNEVPSPQQIALLFGVYRATRLHEIMLLNRSAVLCRSSNLSCE